MLELLGYFLVFHLLEKVRSSFIVLLGDPLRFSVVLTVEVSTAREVPAFFGVGVVDGFASALHIN